MFREPRGGWMDDDGVPPAGALTWRERGVALVGFVVIAAAMAARALRSFFHVRGRP